MKEKLYTIPLNDAVNAQDECPFCYVERAIEQDLLNFVLGSASSYMEADIREMTDKAGFCRMHFQKMFDYGNTLGNAWILKTHYKKMIEEMQKQFSGFKPGKSSLKDKLHKTTESTNAIGVWTRQKKNSCYICNHYEKTYPRYMDTFFYLFKQDDAFRDKIQNSKGFCLPHFKLLLACADHELSGKTLEDAKAEVTALELTHLKRINDEVNWFTKKFDYRNQNEPWGNSKDAPQRAMEKLSKFL